MFSNEVAGPLQSSAIKELMSKLPILPFFALNSITLVPTASWSECVTADTGEVTKEAFLARFHTSLEKLDEDWNATVSLEPAVQRRAAAAISAG
jgi:hypothetical protein